MQRFQSISAAVDESAQKSGKVGIISVGWDPGMFSLNRLYAAACLPEGENYTFWGKGVSQGHSDAIRRIEGVKDARQQYQSQLRVHWRQSRRQQPRADHPRKHTRECFVVAEEGADQAKIENEIKTMPNYFSDYDTTVHFITEEELKRDHNRLPHGGFRNSQRQDRLEQGEPPYHRVQLKAGFQPGIYFLHHRGIRTRGHTR